VTKGDLVSVLSSPELGARRDRVRNELARARIEVAHGCRQAEQDAALLAAGAVTAQKAEASHEACRAANAGVAAAVSALREQELMAGKVQEHAPMDATVLRWHVRPGENVMPGQPLLTLGGPAREVRVPVPEQDLMKGIHTGTRVSLEFPDRTRLEAEVRELAPDAIGPAHTVEARIDLPPERAGALRHGLSVAVSFTLDAVSAWIVPASAVHEDDRSAWVFVVRDQILVRREVFPKLSAGDRIAVNGKFEEGEPVVTDRLRLLRDGLPVWPVPAPERAGGPR
jgi:RND family efflux transporter MFP subunit